MAETVAVIDSAKCDFCGTCVAVCPTNSIDLQETAVIIDTQRCIGCRSCVDICPLGVPEVKE